MVLCVGWICWTDKRQAASKVRDEQRVVRIESQTKPNFYN